MKRVVLFLLTNILVVVTISIVLNLLGVRGYVEAEGLNYSSLLVFCGVWGMAGAFISLGLSKVMAKWMMGVEILDPRAPLGATERFLLETVHNQARAAGIETVPEVGIYNSAEVNAFATGPTRNRALVAVSRGLLEQMSRSEVEGVLGHEVSHIANGDMVTMTLIQGVINAFVMFFARIAAYAISQFISRNDDDGHSPSPWLHFGLVFLFDILFSVLGSLVVAAFSRQREFRADQGGAQLAGRPKMIAALERLQQSSGMIESGQKSFASLKISAQPGGIWRLLMTHPPLERRIEKLKVYG